MQTAALYYGTAKTKEIKPQVESANGFNIV